MLLTDYTKHLSEPFIRRAAANREQRETSNDSVGIGSLVTCLRKPWYRKHGVEGQPLSADSELVFLIGEAFHQTMLKGLGGLETFVARAGMFGGKPYKIVGYLDALNENREAEIVTPIEFKSTRSRDVGQPSPQYIEQLAGYCWMLGVNTGLLYVLHIVSAVVKSWGVGFPTDELESWGKELERRATWVLGNEEPSRIEHYEWECARCPYHKTASTPNGVCLGGGGRTVGWFSFEGKEKKPK